MRTKQHIRFSALSYFQLVLLVTLFFFTPLLQAQPNTGIDENQQIKTRIDSLLKFSWSLAREKPLEGLSLLAQIEELHTRQDTAYKEDVVFYYYGIFYKNLNRFDESEAHFNKYEAYHEKRGHKSRVAAVNMAKANLFSDKGDLTRSMESASRALKLTEELQDTTAMIRAGSKLGFLLSEVGSYDEALSYHRLSLKLSKEIGDAREENIAYSNLAIVFEKQNMLDSALAAYTKAYHVGKTLPDAYGRVLDSHNMANILSKMNQNEASLPYTRECMSLADSIDIPSLRVLSRLIFAQIKLQMEDEDTAIIILDSLITEINHDIGLKDRMELHGLSATAHAQKGDFEAAFNHHQTFKTLSDSLISLESRNKINELEIQYESEKKQQKIAFLDLENQTSKALIKQKDRTILIGGIGLFLVTLFSIGLYILIRKYLRQQKELSKALHDKDLLLREIHHRVKNNLQIVSSLLSLQGRSIDDASALNAINAGKSRVRSMALIHQSLYQRENLTGVNVQEYMRKLCTELFHTYNVDESKVTLNMGVEQIELDVDTLVPLGLIVNELITNSLKYAFPEGKEGKLSVKLALSQDVLLLEVSDNGVGYNEADVRENSFGRKLIGSLVKQLEGVLNTDSAQGTRVRLEVHKFKSSKRL